MTDRLSWNKDSVFALISLVISIALALIAFSYPSDSSWFPRILCLTIVLLSLALLIQSRRQKTKNSGEDEQNIFSKRTLSFYILCVIYILALPRIGFFVSSYFFIVAACMMFKYKNKFVVFLWPAVLSVVLWGVFTYCLNVPTPQGIFS